MRCRVGSPLVTCVWMAAWVTPGCGTPSPSFVCTDSVQCDVGVGGVCQPTGYCSFPDASCPSGQRYGEFAGTMSGLCVGDEPGGPDAADAASSPTVCGGTRMLRGFSMAMPDTWLAAGSGTMSGTTPGSNSITLGGTRALGTVRYYDLRGDQVSVEVDVAAIGRTYLAVGSGGAKVELFQEGGVLRFGIRNGTVFSETAAIAYSASAHRWWRLQESGGMVRWGYSADGDTWSDGAAVQPPFPLDNVSVHLGVTTAGAATATFARLNDGQPAGTWCLAHSVRDGFDDGLPGSLWKRAPATQVNCAASESGVLVFAASTPSMGTANCTYLSSTAYSFTGDITIRVDPPQMSQSVDTVSFGFVDANGKQVGFRYEVSPTLGPTLGVGFIPPNQARIVTSYTYSAEAHRWWRVRRNGAAVAWEVSPGPVSGVMTWTNLPGPDVGDVTFDMVDVGIVLETMSESDTSPVTTVGFDDFNSPPP